MELTSSPCDPERIQSLELQLQICRAMLAVAYREHNAVESALAHAEATVTHLRRQRHDKHQLLRTWILRSTATNPGQN